ncbi:MAG: hypothetical protein L6W00_30385 [Lentisphaeria bacterium]|nr:MAG: hypothetical protein L6W00_30385 [Lentisphaeria bacterium]
MKSSLSLFTTIVLLATVTAAREQNSTVRRFSAGPGGSCRALAIHPKNSGIILSGLDMGYAFRTADGGKSWQVLGDHNKTNPGYRGCFGAAFSASNPKIAWIVSEHGAYKSTDGGITFELMTASLGGEGRRYTYVTIDPDDCNRVYIMQGGTPNMKPSKWTCGWIFFTADGGLTWTRLAPPVNAEPGSGFTELVIDSLSNPKSRRLMVSGYSGLYVSENGGMSWKSIADRLPFPPGAEPRFGTLDSVKVGKEVRTLLTVLPGRTPAGSCYGGVYSSFDFGKTWKESNGGLNLTKLTLPPEKRNGWIVRSCASHPDRCYLGIHSPGSVYRSDDGGKNWKIVTNPDTVYKRFDNEDGTSRTFLINGGGGNFRNSLVWRVDGMMNLAVSAADPDTIAYNDNCGTTMSTDGGKSWSDIMFDYTDAFAPGLFGDIHPVKYTHRIKSRGVHLLCSSGMYRDIFDSRIFYAGIFDHGIMISRDGGESWECPTRGLRTSGETGWGWCHSITLEPRVKGRLYATFGTNRAYRSDDFGHSWVEIGPSDAVTKNRKEKLADSGIVIETDAPITPGTLYLCANYGLWKTTDGGKSWRKTVNGLPPGPVTKLVKIGKTLFAGSMLDNDTDGRRFHQYGLFRSDDGAESWHPVCPEKLGKRIFCIAFCKSAPENIYVVTKEGTGYWGEGKIWRSQDAGKTWNLVASGKEYRFVAVNPYNPNWIYSHYTSFDVTKQPAWVRSTDGGKNWKTISGEVAMTGRVYNLLIDQNDPRRVFYHEPYAVCEYFDSDAPVKK